MKQAKAPTKPASRPSSARHGSPARTHAAATAPKKKKKAKKPSGGGGGGDDDVDTTSPEEEEALEDESDEIGVALNLMRRQRTSAGDNVKALCDITCSRDDMNIYMEIAKKLASLRCADGTVPIAGLCAPAGGGKSTLVQILRLILEQVLLIGQVVEVSLDDFLSSQQERKERHIRTRWDVHATNADLGASCLWKLKHAHSEDSTIELPCFSKGRDERIPEPRIVRGKVALVIFEGWRIGVDHPNFEPFNSPIDLLIYLRVDFDAIFRFKYECAKRDIGECGYDLYEQYGGFDEVFRRYYRRVADEYILPVEGWCDVVVEKDAQHHVKPPVWQNKWAEKQAASRIEATHTVVVGSGQAGLCASYYLGEKRVPHVVLEREAIGSTWQTARWDSFRLVTENSLCAMPNFPTTEVGHALDGFMPQQEIARYLREFATKNGIVTRKLAMVQVTRGWSGWVVQTREAEAGGKVIWFRCASVVMAAGGFHKPKLPPWANELPKSIHTLHSKAYKRPADLPAEGGVVVVGTAQSGSQIALELCEAGRSVYLCLSRTSFRVPRRIRGRDMTWWLWKTGLYDTSVDQLTPAEVKKKRRSPNPSQAPAKDLRFRELALKHGLVYTGHALRVAEGKLHVDAEMVGPTMEKVEANVLAMQSLVQKHIDKHAVRDPSLCDLPPMEVEPHFDKPSCETSPLESVDLSKISTVVFATGYSLDFESMIDVHGLCDETGYPHQYRGVSSAMPGLYFLGLPWLHKWQSVTLLGASEDAEYVATHIANNASSSTLTPLAPVVPAGGAPATTTTVGSASSPHPVPLTRGPSLRARQASAKNLQAALAFSAAEQAQSSDGSVGTMGKPQLYGPDALARTFDTWRQLIDGNSTADAIRPVPSADGAKQRAPLTYVRLAALMDASPQMLAGLGIGRTDRLCSALPNGPEAASAFLVLSLSCVYAPLNCALTEAELAFEFEDLPAKAIVVMKNHPGSARVRQVAAKMNVAIIEMVPSETEAGWFELERDNALDAINPPPPPTRDDLCLVLHTSGTTNKPKIVPLSHANISSGSLCIASTLQLVGAGNSSAAEGDEEDEDDEGGGGGVIVKRPDVNLNVMPLFHIHGLSINVLATLFSGATVIASTGFDPDAFFVWADQCAPTWYSAVPTMHLRVLQKAEERYASTGAPPPHTLELLRNCSAALLPSVASRLQEVLNLKVMPTYAMTESMPIASHPRFEACELRSVGYAAGPMVRVLDDNGAPCAIDKEGEVCVRGSCVTRGYEYREHMSADPNIAAFHTLKSGGQGGGEEERWLRTGDKGYVDSAEGTLTLVGRFKEIINRGGEKISPLEIEDVLRQHPAVRDLIVFAAKHKQLGEVPGAALVLRAGKTITLQELRAHGAETLPIKWLPETLVLMADIPKGPTGKPARIGLGERLGLPELSDAGNGGITSMWDASDTSPQATGPITVKPFAPLPPSAEEQSAGLDAYLAIEADVMNEVGETAGAGLSLSGLHRCVRVHLCQALRSEVSEVLMLPVARVNVEMQLSSLGLESIMAIKLHERLQRQLGCNVPLPSLLGGSIAELAEHLSGLMSFGGGAPALAFSIPDAAARKEGDSKAALEASPVAITRQLSLSYPMRPLQTAYLVGRELSQQSAWLYWETELRDFDEERFNWAVNTLVKRHEALRTAMSADGTQRIFQADEVPTFATEMRRAPEAVCQQGDVAMNDWLAGALQSVRQEATRWMPQSYPMFKIVGVWHGDGGGSFKSRRVRLAFLFDLLLADAASLNVLTTELSQLYTASSNDAGLALLPPITRTHREHVLSFEAASKEPEALIAKAKEDAYWARRLAAVEDGGLPAAPNLPMSTLKASASDANALSRSSATLSKAQWAKFKAECLLRGLTPTIGLLSVYASVLSAYSSKHFTMTMANFGRGGGAEKVVGNLADVMLVEVDFREKSSFEAHALSLAREVWTVIDHSKYTSGVKVMSQLNERDGTPNQAASPYVFASVLGASEEESASAVGDAQLFKWFGAVRPVRGSGALNTPQVLLDHQCFIDSDGSLFYNWDFHAAKFPPGMIDQLFDTYHSCLERLASNPEAWRRPLLLVPEAHVQQQLSIQVEEQRPDLLEQLEPLHWPFARLASTQSESIAVCDKDVRLSFGELHALACAGADQISSLAGASRAPVGVLIDKSCVQAVAVLSAQFSGRAYVPITLGQPPSRIRQIVGAVEAAVVLVGPSSTSLSATQEMLGDASIALELKLERLQPSGSVAFTAASCKGTDEAPLSITLDADQVVQAAAESSAMELAGKLSDLAYIIFTSGSTGVPKGVAISHRGAANTCLDINERFGIGAKDVVLSLASLAFDLSVYDLFGVMAAGGKLVMPDTSLARDPEHWLDLLEREKVTVWNTAPPVMSMLLEWVVHNKEATARFNKLALRVVMLSGDFCALWVPRELQRLLPAENDLTVYTLGGATEASIWSCFYKVAHVPDEWRSIPYGGPLANQTLYVLDAHLAISPMLVPGQIVIGGTGLAEEYWRDEAKTSASFVYAELHGKRERVYLTGDLGRYVIDSVSGKSVVEILGRLDFQVKIHGNRVEIGEVEAALRACPTVSGAVVLPAKLRGVTELVAFVESSEGETAKIAALEAAGKALPPYMVPAMTHAVAKLPMSSNGKVDRKALIKLHEEACAAQATDDSSMSSAAEEPRTESEVRLHGIWQQVLGREGVSLNVFARFHSELGGTSLAITRMRIAVEAEFGVKVPLPVLLERETIVSLAEWLDDRGTGKALDTPNVVCYQRSGSLPPFFCVAPVAGQVLCYKQLAEELGPEQPFYALQSFGLNDGETPMKTVEAMASALLEQVASITARFARHQRRFHLGGWSMGGVVALEMWLQLSRKAASEGVPLEVGQLVLLDSPAPFAPMPTFTDTEMLATFAADLTSCRASFELPTADALATIPDARDRVLKQLEHVLPRETLERTFQVYCENLRALSAYRPAVGKEAAALRLHLVKASDSNPHLKRYPGHAAIDLGWTQTGLRASQVLLYLQGGDHYFVTDATKLPAIARQLGRILDDPDERSSAAQDLSAPTMMVVQSSSRTSVVRDATPRPLTRLNTGLSSAFRTASSSSRMADWDRAVLDAYTDLLKKLRTTPHVLIVSAHSSFPSKSVAAMLHGLCPSAVIHGTSSCRGCITSDGHDTFGLLGIVDPDGKYAVGMSPGATDAATARDAGRAAAQSALNAVRRQSQGGISMPAVAVINGAPSCEELVLQGIEDVLGGDVPVIGGSSADEALDGSWWGFAIMPRDQQAAAPVAMRASAAARATSTIEGSVASDAVVISLMWPSVSTKLVMSSAFQPTAARGTITRAEGRTIHEIDGQSAAQVYANWSASPAFSAKLSEMEKGGGAQGVLADTTLNPLGREKKSGKGGGGGDFHSLVHPARILDGGGLECFADCKEGETLVLMAAQQGLDTLVHHPTRVMQSAGIARDALRGCLVIYCGGCAIAIEDKLQAVAQSFADSLGGGSVNGDGGGPPFLGMFTYGEQCRTPHGNQHVNLMYAVLAFCEE